MIVSQAVPPAIHLAYRGPVIREMLEFPLATTMWMEARNQPYVGRVAVGFTIKNRVHANQRRWGGNTYLGVVTKRKQYSCHNYFHHRMDSNRREFMAMMRKAEGTPEKKLWHSIQAEAHDVAYGRIPNNIGSATHYATVSIKPYWRYDMTVVGQIGAHVFFREKTSAEVAAYHRDMKANRLLAKARRVARRANKRQVPISYRYRAS